MAKSWQDDLIRFDSRMLEFNLARGIITKEEYEQHIKQLPDLKSQTVPLGVEEPSNQTEH